MEDDAGTDGSPDLAALQLGQREYPQVIFPDENPFNPDKALLGKMLFWDEQLSADDSVACGTCHLPSAGGADPRPAAPGFVGHPGEDGVRGTDDDPRGSPGIRRCARDVDGNRSPVEDPLFGDQVQVTRRRAMGALDAMFWQELFWDGRAGDRFVDPLQPDQVLIASRGALESQAVAPLQNSVEMACDGFSWAALTEELGAAAPLARASELPADISSALAQNTDYPALFQAAFGTAEITPARVAFAIATYERTLVADQTPWDRFVRGDPRALSDQQARGALVFLGSGRCACCHAPPLFGGVAYGNDGFSERIWDAGRFEVTGVESDRAAFRIPSLRNVGLREAGGLLHDGVGAGADLDTLLERYNVEPLFPVHIGLCVRSAPRLSAERLADLAEFLRSGLTDPRALSETPPFDRPRLGSEAP